MVLQYDRFNALNRERARAYIKRNRLYRENGIPIPPPKRKRTSWHA